MAERKNIAIFFSYNEAWIGGTYYILSLIHALNTLTENKKPKLFIVCANDDEYKIIQKTNYPFLEKKLVSEVNFQGKLTLFDRVINKASKTIFGRYVIEKKAELNLEQKINAAFPCPALNTFNDVDKSIFWIPDFQEKHLPEFFNNDEIEKRNQFSAEIAKKNRSIVFSSNDAANDFNELYTENKCKKAVVPFAVNHPEYTHLDILLLKQKYQIHQPYFFSPNQFWKHKNHSVIIDAAKILLEKGIHQFQIAFSGKESDFRNPEYAHQLKEKVKLLNLENNILFLGFIDRAEQLQLMNHAIAVIQPSLFEGWSTVIEDAKSMHQPIVASNLKIHQEQLKHYKSVLFDPTNAEELASFLEAYLKNQPPKMNNDYASDIKTFAQSFMSFINE